MELSPTLSAKFEKLQNSYPVKRSALIPMLMYAQDEYGCVSDEMIAEIGQRLGWFPHTVRAAITGLRKAGREVTRSKDADDRSVYRLAPVETAGER